MEISELPDDCIFIMLKSNFPVTKLIRLRAVSTTWKKIIDKICLSKTELNLFNGKLDMVNIYKDADPYRLMKKADLKQLAPNLLTLSHDAKVVNFISRLFPHVTKLVCGLKNSYQVALLLNYWSDTLEDVTIIGKLLTEDQVRHFFWDVLNSMPKLKRLSYHIFDSTGIENQHFSYAYFVPPFVTVFNQLEYFAITGRADQVFDIFGYKKHKSGQAVVALTVNSRSCTMLAKLTHLVLIDQRGYTALQTPIIKAIFASAEAIRYLDISNLNLKLADLMPELQHINNLESIRLKLTQLIHGNGVICPDRFNSIKRVHLIDTTVVNSMYIEKSIYPLMPLFFPSLEHLEVAVKDAKLMRQIQAIIPRSILLSFVP